MEHYIRLALFSHDYFSYADIDLARYHAFAKTNINSGLFADLEAYDLKRWDSMSVNDKLVILEKVVKTFNLYLDRREIMKDIDAVWKLLSPINRNILVRWWHRSKFKNQEYTKFLKGT